MSDDTVSFFCNGLYSESKYVVADIVRVSDAQQRFVFCS